MLCKLQVQNKAQVSNVRYSINSQTNWTRKQQNKMLDKYETKLKKFFEINRGKKSNG